MNSTNDVTDHRSGNSHYTSSGVMMVGLILTILALALLAGGFILVLGTGTLSAIESAESSDASLAAETGLSLARSYIATNAAWHASPPAITGTIGTATFQTALSPSNNLDAVLTSVGQDATNQRTAIFQYLTRGLAAYTQSSQTAPRYRVISNLGALTPERGAEGLRVSSAHPGRRGQRAGPLVGAQSRSLFRPVRRPLARLALRHRRPPLGRHGLASPRGNGDRFGLDHPLARHRLSPDAARRRAVGSRLE
ncbi:MAG: hypothetical protein QME60_03680 [Verrucomicrobiota bacterium]|nr:hypothetical protein [Verrucomicrobiota bacterium]